MPVAVIVCGVFQLAAVNTIDEGETLPSVESLELRAIVTLASGSDSSCTVKVTAPPDSLVKVPDGAETVMPAVSSSVLVSATSAGFRPL